MARTEIHVHLATIPNRRVQLLRVINALSPQCSSITVYCNEYNALNLSRLNESIERIANVTILTGDDLSDSGKFKNHDGDGYHLTVDDDLFYPPDYVSKTVALIEKYGRTAAVSWHGKIFNDSGPWSSYYRGSSERGFRCLGSVSEDVQVHLPGTGVFGYHTDTVAFDISEFPSPNMADIHAGISMKRKGVPCICGAHAEGWITHQTINYDHTIFARFRHHDKEQTARVNAERPWPELNVLANG